MKSTGLKALRKAGLLAIAASLFMPSFGARAAKAEETAISAAGSAASASSVHTVKIHTDRIVQTDFLGVGVNSIPANLMNGTTQFGYTDAHWEMDRKRISTVQPKVARVWFQIDWMEPEKGVYTWDSAEMRGFYAYLDAFREAGTDIELNFGWKIGSKVHEWFNIPGVDPWTSAPADLDAYAASASALLQELRDRGYDNVKYLTFYNEPNGSWDFEAPGDQRAYYAELVKKVSDRLTADGLRQSVEIWGPEETGAPAWTQYMKDNVDSYIDGYSFHVYGEAYDGLGAQIKARKDYVAPKPVHLTEFGWADDNASNWTAGFANSVIQAANSGAKSALIWQLNGTWSPDPFGGTNGVYTMWDSILLGMEPRKTFYIGGLLTRYIPAHSTVLEVDTGSPDLRAAAFRTEDGHYTILLESKEGAAKDVTFDFGGTAIDKTFRKFEYGGDVQPEGNALLPQSSGTFRAGASFRDSAVGDGYTVIVYTTAEPETQVKVTPLTPTVKSGDKLRLGTEVIDNGGGVTWSVAGKKNGSINKHTGVYHAPQVDDETVVAVKAESDRDPSAYGVVLVKVLPKSVRNRVEVPAFSLTPGVYPSAEALTLATATPDAEIRYTTDGSTPTESSALYVRPIILKNASLALYKAKAFKPGLKPSGTTSALYQIGDVSNAPDGYEFCMYEDGECYFEGEAIVAYGADGLFNYKIASDGVACSSDVFGDPNPGVPKRCFFSAEIPEEIPVVTFYNAGFEKPATTSARPGPMTNGWTFSDRAGVQRNNGVFQPPTAPQGVQTAYLKTDGGVPGVLSQQINFKPGTYQLSFQAAKRTSFGGMQTFDVYLDDTVIGSFAPSAGTFVTYRTEPFTTEGGKHTIKFAATTTVGDNTAFIDDVRITLPVAPAEPNLANPSFESPAATGVTGVLTGLTAGWGFNAMSGIVRNGSAMEAPNAPLGVQAAYLQTKNGEKGAFTQSADFPAGTYTINFRAAGRSSGEPLTFDVTVDGTAIDSFTAESASYQAYSTSFFTVEAGVHEVGFAAASSDGDRAAFLDAVSIERIEVPEQPALANGGFESPAVTSANGVQVGGAAGWTFGTTAGMIRNGSVFEAPDAPEGAQAGYLQTVNGISGEFSQTAVFPAGTYAVKFQAAKRTGFGGTQSFRVYFDNQPIGSFAPSTGEYMPFATASFTVHAPGKHTIRFAAATTAGDNTAFIDAIEIGPADAAEAQPIANGGFETPPVTNASGVLVGSTNGWTFNAFAGIQRNGSAFGPADAPEGIQSAFLQTNGGQGEFSQTVFLPAGSHMIFFQAAKRSFGGVQSFTVSVDGTAVGSFAPGATTFKAYATDSFTVEAGEHTIRFAAAASTGDNTAFIDAVTVGAPEPPEPPAFDNAGFESPATASVRSGPFTAGWSFNNRAGVQRNGSAFGAAPAPEGVQTALLQTRDGIGGAIEQSVHFQSGTYAISFQAARRPGFGGLQTFDVYVDDQAVGGFTPSADSFEAFETAPFTVASGSHTIRLAATTTSGDNTCFLDDFRILVR